MMALRRQWLVGVFLQRKARTIYEIADEFMVSKATAQRDVDTLRSLFEIRVIQDFTHSQRVRYRMQGRFVARR